MSVYQHPNVLSEICQLPDDHWVYWLDDLVVDNIAKSKYMYVNLESRCQTSRAPPGRTCPIPSLEQAPNCWRPKSYSGAHPECILPNAPDCPDYMLCARWGKVKSLNPTDSHLCKPKVDWSNTKICLCQRAKKCTMPQLPHRSLLSLGVQQSNTLSRSSPWLRHTGGCHSSCMASISTRLWIITGNSSIGAAGTSSKRNPGSLEGNSKKHVENPERPFF